MQPLTKLPSAQGMPHGARMAALACAAALLLGCTTTTYSPSFVDAPKPPASSGLATVYIYRIGNWNQNHGNTRLLINGKKAATLKQDDYTWMQLEPGEYTFEENQHWLQKPDHESHTAYSLQATVAADETYYVIMDIAAENIRTAETLTMVMIGDVLVPMNQQIAVADARTVAVRFDAEEKGLAHVENRKFQAHEY